MSVAPDIDGFVEAQARLRAQTGTAVTFKVPVPATWPEGTKLNEATGLPYDATIKPTSDAYTDVVKTVGVVLKQASPLRPQPDTVATPAGEMSGMDIILNVAADDYADIEEATEVFVNGLGYQVVEAKPFSLADNLYRWLIYGLEL